MHTIWVWCPSKSRAIILEWVQSVWKTSLMHQKTGLQKIKRWRLELKTSYRPINQPIPSLFHWMARWSLPTSHWFFIWKGAGITSVSQENANLLQTSKNFVQGEDEIAWISWNSGSETLSWFHLFILNRPMSFDEMSSLGTLQISWLPNRKAYWLLVISSLEFFCVVLQILWGIYGIIDDSME